MIHQIQMRFQPCGVLRAASLRDCPVVFFPLFIHARSLAQDQRLLFALLPRMIMVADPHFFLMDGNDSMPAAFLDGGGVADKENGGALWACGQTDLGDVWPFGH